MPLLAFVKEWVVLKSSLNLSDNLLQQSSLVKLELSGVTAKWLQISHEAARHVKLQSTDMYSVQKLPTLC